MKKISLIYLVIFISFGYGFGAKPTKPNIIIINTDDLGYSDLGCYGSNIIKTPNIDKLASEGVKFTDFYVAQPVCSASRAALLTGCYPNRIGIHGALFPNSVTGINSEETTLAEICKSVGYKTAMAGKWHLGTQKKFLPINHGFDEYYGIPYSNDMWPKNTVGKFPPLPLIENDSAVGFLDVDQKQLTTSFTERSVRFIKENRKKSFFLYLAHPMPHVPLYVSDERRGKSENGLYADVISELDWSVGEIMKALKKYKLEKNTILIFTSDNGPWLAFGGHAGSAAPLREGKQSVLEGGVRVPFIMRWPDHVPPGAIQKTPAMNIDILPTIAKIIGAKLPDNEIDGKNILPLMKNQPDAVSPHEAYFFYFNQNELQAVRMGPWKLYFPHTYNSFAGLKGNNDGTQVPYQKIPMKLELYNLESDISEKNNVAEANPQIVFQIINHADVIRAQLGDKLKAIEGKENRKPGVLN